MKTLFDTSEFAQAKNNAYNLAKHSNTPNFSYTEKISYQVGEGTCSVTGGTFPISNTYNVTFSFDSQFLKEIHINKLS